MRISGIEHSSDNLPVTVTYFTSSVWNEPMWFQCIAGAGSTFLTDRRIGGTLMDQAHTAGARERLLVEPRTPYARICSISAGSSNGQCDL